MPGFSWHVLWRDSVFLVASGPDDPLYCGVSSTVVPAGRTSESECCHPMSEITRERLFGFGHAFDHPATGILLAGVGGILILAAPILILAARRGDAAGGKDLWRRYLVWLVIVPVFMVPILAGAFWTMLLILLLSLLCYREYARATGLFREKLISLLVILSILAVHFTVLDNWHFLFVALFPFSIGAIASLSLFQDRPKGYIQRVALGVFAFALFGSCLGHLGFLANDAEYRPWVLFLLVAIELNTLAAFATGRLLGGRKLCPQTSPTKTVAGAVGGLVVTTTFALFIGPLVFQGTRLDHLARLGALGVLLSVVAQFGDLMLSSIKRDLGLKDMDVLIPGHGGLLDRFDNLVLVSPVMFHYVNYFIGVGIGQPVCIFSGAR
jgi:phosphatidate cytidylyltransferase